MGTYRTEGHDLYAQETPRRWHVSRDAVHASSGVMVMGGLSAIVLGVIALSVDPVLPLVLTAVLCVAAALMLSGGSLLARFRERLA